MLNKMYQVSALQALALGYSRAVINVGELAGEYAFGGAWQQAEILLSEGVEVKDGRVDLEQYQWKHGS